MLCYLWGITFLGCKMAQRRDSFAKIDLLHSTLLYVEIFQVACENEF